MSLWVKFKINYILFWFEDFENWLFPPSSHRHLLQHIFFNIFGCNFTTYSLGKHRNKTICRVYPFSPNYQVSDVVAIRSSLAESLQSSHPHQSHEASWTRTEFICIYIRAALAFPSHVGGGRRKVRLEYCYRLPNSRIFSLKSFFFLKAWFLARESHTRACRVRREKSRIFQRLSLVPQSVFTLATDLSRNRGKYIYIGWAEPQQALEVQETSLFAAFLSGGAAGKKVKKH